MEDNTDGDGAGTGTGTGTGGAGAGAAGTPAECDRASKPRKVSINSCVSLLNRRSEISIALRRARCRIDAGKASGAGIDASPISTGSTLRCNSSAAATSRTTVSVGLSRRRAPLLSVAVSQCGPISTSTISHSCSVRLMLSTKSSPYEIESMSMKTCSRPNAAARRSSRRPAYPPESARRYEMKIECMRGVAAAPLLIFGW